MIIQMFSIFDSKSLAYSPPFFQTTKGLAIRIFSDLATDTTNQVGRHPTDFTLFFFGDFDDNTGKFDLLITPVSMLKASETVDKEPDT